MSQGIEDLKEEIKTLQARVEWLEEKAKKPTRQGPSPYDLSAKKGCPHKPQYRNCWCG
jgi:hypothetical protein